jgi:leucyl/phenylalanyl-tRNA--protein transferase
MPIFHLTAKIAFPNPTLSNSDGLLAVGGDLSPQRLLLAYQMGIFPWFNEGDPILWWSPNPRTVLYPKDLKIAKSMKQLLKNNRFQCTVDTCFERVIDECSLVPRKDQSGTWITEDMKNAYIYLHELGYAHSVEVWQQGELVGGLYGVSLGKLFFGESMFAKTSNASKFGFISFVEKLKERGYVLIDCQVHTDHLESLGAVEIPKKMFLDYLAANTHEPTWKGKWTDLF